MFILLVCNEAATGSEMCNYAFLTQQITDNTPRKAFLAPFKSFTKLYRREELEGGVKRASIK